MTAPTPRPSTPPSAFNLRRRLRLLRWAVPAGLTLTVIAYELLLSNWIEVRLGAQAHFVAGVAFYGLFGPALAFAIIEILERWLDERETSDVQSQALARAHETAHRLEQLNDDAIQVLYASNLLLDLLEPNLNRLPPDVVERIHQARPMLEATIQKLRAGRR